MFTYRVLLLRQQRALIKWEMGLLSTQDIFEVFSTLIYVGDVRFTKFGNPSCGVTDMLLVP